MFANYPRDSNINSDEDINFSRQRLKLSHEEFVEIAEAIKKQIKNLK